MPIECSRTTRIPADIYYQGKPFSIVQQDSNRLQFAVKVPFITEKDLEIRLGSDNKNQEYNGLCRKCYSVTQDHIQYGDIGDECK